MCVLYEHLKRNNPLETINIELNCKELLKSELFKPNSQLIKLVEPQNFLFGMNQKQVRSH